MATSKTRLSTAVVCALIVALKVSANTQLVARECEKNTIYNLDARRVHCAVLTHTPNNPEASIKLPVAIIKSSVYKKNRKALIIVPGGPGMGGSTANTQLQFWYRFFYKGQPHALDFDIVLYEPRGTPNAQPSWPCKSFASDISELFSSDVSSSEEYRQYQKAIQACINQNGLRSHQLASLAAKQQIDDLTHLINQLDYSEVHLLAESWGTRIVQGLRANKIASLILDSPYPLEHGSQEIWLDTVDKRFDILQKTYREFRPNQDWEKLWKAARSRLKKKSMTLTVSDRHFVLNEHRLVAFAFHALYQENKRIPFFKVLEAIAASKHSQSVVPALTQFARAYLHSYLADDFSPLAWHAAMCSDRPSASAEHVQNKKNAALHYAYFTDGMWAFDVCNLAALLRDNKQQAPLASATVLGYSPSLILAGEYDPVTPASWAKVLAEAPLSTLYIAKGGGHGIIKGDYCQAEMIIQFISKHSVNPKEFCD